MWSRPLSFLRERHALLVFFASWTALLLQAPGMGHYLINPDHGYQLSMGQMILDGRWPFVDFFLHHGPLVSLSSALAMALTGNLLGETVLCATGYAVAIALMSTLVMRRTSLLAGWLVAVLGLLLLARFYKWYYWLWPMAVLWGLARYFAVETREVAAADDRAARARLGLVGVLAGLGALYRLELGPVFIVLVALLLLLTGRRPQDSRKTLARGMYVLTGMAIPFVLWFGSLLVAGGLTGIRDFVVGSVVGVHDTATFWRRPFPTFQVTTPLAMESAHAALLFVLFPATYSTAIFLGVWIDRTKKNLIKGYTDGRFLIAGALLGILSSPQAYYRPDPQHLYQVLPVFYISFFLILNLGWRKWCQSAGPGKHLMAICIAMYALIFSLALWGVVPQGAKDMAPIESSVVSRYRSLAAVPLRMPKAEIPTSDLSFKHERDVAEFLSEIRRRTDSGEPILVVGYMPQVYFFARRPMSGILNMYTTNGFFTGDEWRQRTLHHIRANPPALVVTPSDLFVAERSEAYHLLHPELFAFLRESFSEHLMSRAKWSLWGPTTESSDGEARRQWPVRPPAGGLE